jgi:hypothetical protein
VYCLRKLFTANVVQEITMYDGYRRITVVAAVRSDFIQLEEDNSGPAPGLRIKVKMTAIDRIFYSEDDQ